MAGPLKRRSPLPPGARQRPPLLLDRLGQLYPEATCSLDWRTPYKLMVATRLSASNPTSWAWCRGRNGKTPQSA
jgi:hypothetical protein